MQTAYLDCASGISGDMTLGALIDAGANLAAIQAGIDSLGLAACRLVTSEVKKRGFRATQLVVEHEPEHVHRHLAQIMAMIDRGNLTPRARELATRIFRQFAEAEARVHGTTIEKVHFHEAGAADSIADVVGAAIGFDLLGVERIVCSPVPTGHGFVQIAHGRCSIPAPATGELLRGVPLAPLDVEGELTTPTGAAIVAAIANDFGPLPAMTVERIGYGAGQNDFPQPNILRLLVGTQSVGTRSAEHRPHVESIVLLESNLDDCPGDAIGHTMERLLAAGALDVAVTPIQMKKGRPGVLLSVQAQPADAGALEEILFQETTTLGVRRQQVLRTVLAREPHEVSTEWGPIAGKIAYLPDGSARFAPEYDACHRASTEHRVPLADVVSAAQQAFRTDHTSVLCPTMDDDPHLSQIQTLWSVVELAHGDATAMQSAQQMMLDRYGGAVRRYALAALRDEDAADEVFQEFALKFVRGDFRAADPGRGRFRAFVKTVVYRLIVDYQRRQKKLGREAQMHSNLAEPGEVAAAMGDGDADAMFHASWRDELLARCWGKLAEYECTSGKPYHTVLRYRVDHPEVRSPALAEGLSKKLGKPASAGAVRVLLHRSRDAFADLLLEEVIHSLADGSLDAAEQELIELDLLGYCKPALARRREKT